MFAPSVILILVFLGPQAFGSDVDFYSRVFECARNSILNKKLQGYSPYVFNESFSPNGAGFTVNYTDIKLSGVPNYTLNAFQLSKEGAKIVRISYRAFWKRLVVEAHAKGSSGEKKYEGPALITLSNVTCHGTVYYERPGCNHIRGRVIDLDSFCESDGILIKFSLLPTQPFEEAATTLYYNKLALEEKRRVQDFLIDRLNTEWFAKPRKIDELFNSCHFQV